MTTFRRGRSAWRSALVPLPEMIADAVAEAIALGRLLPDERVVEATIAAELGVSRVPTREALKVLHTQGILTGGRRGFRVAAFDAEMIARIMELRLMLECLLLRDAIAHWRAGQADVAVLDAAIAELEGAARRGEKLGSLRADLAFHRAIGQAAGKGITLTLWEAIARHALIIFSRPEYRDDDLAAVVTQHRALRQFIQDQIAEPGPLEALRQGIEAHLLQVPRARGAG
ncbi:GntR family transcriptional regulator [Falsiroseomonas sp.]|uniref:GntR family transcriptional regulator n=1 Tax=Falsiroseomonas sp. TaxID=2870721 RepID=UPI003F7133CF